MPGTGNTAMSAVTLQSLFERFRDSVLGVCFVRKANYCAMRGGRVVGVLFVFFQEGSEEVE